jgi:hypothetical protein
MSVMLDWTTAPLLRCGKYLNQVLALASLIARNASEAMMESDWSLKSGGRFCVGMFGRNLVFSRREDVLTFNLLYKDLVYVICTFNKICENNAAIVSYIAIQHKQGPFP